MIHKPMKQERFNRFEIKIVCQFCFCSCFVAQFCKLYKIALFIVNVRLLLPFSCWICFAALVSINSIILIAVSIFCHKLCCFYYLTFKMHPVCIGSVIIKICFPFAVLHDERACSHKLRKAMVNNS